MKHITLWDLLLTFKLRAKVFLGIFLAVILAVVLYVFLSKPKYKIEGKVRIDIMDVYPSLTRFGFVGLDLGLALGGLRELYKPSVPVDKVGSEMLIVESESVLGEVVRSLGLNLEIVPPEGTYVEYKRFSGDTLTTKLKLVLQVEDTLLSVLNDGDTLCTGKLGENVDCGIFTFVLGGKGKGRGSIVVKPFYDVYLEWKDKLSVDQSGLTDILSISLEASKEDIHFYRTIVDSVIEAYRRFTLMEYRKVAEGIRKELIRVRDSISKELVELSRELIEMKNDASPVVSALLENVGLVNRYKNIFEGEALAELIRRAEIYRNQIREFATKRPNYETKYANFVALLENFYRINILLNEMEIARMKITSPVQVISYANVPTTPTWPKKKLLIGIGIIVAFILAVLGVFTYELLTKSVGSPLRFKLLFSDRISAVFYSKQELSRYISSMGKVKLFVEGEGGDPEEADVLVLNFNSREDVVSAYAKLNRYASYNKPIHAIYSF